MKSWRPILTLAVVAFFPLLLGAFALISFRLTAVATVTIATILLLYWAVWFIGTVASASGKIMWGYIPMVIWFFVGVVMFTTLFTLVLPNLRIRPHVLRIIPVPPAQAGAKIEKYEVVLSRVPKQGFVVQHQMVITTQQGQVGSRIQQHTIPSANEGLFVKTVEIHLVCDAGRNRQSPHARQNRMGASCPDSVRVRLSLPADMFFQAKGGHALRKSLFLTEESIEWTQYAEQPIEFAYLAPPGHLAKPLLPEYVWTHTGGRLSLVALFALATAIMSIVFGIVTDRIKSWLKARRQVAEQ